MSDFIITRLSQAMVLPTKPTPTGNLPLSSIDKALGMRNMMELFQVFHSGHQPAKLIRQALALALVSYYPVAGRLVELHVACTGEGVWLSEATANCSLNDLNIIDSFQPLLIPVSDLLPTINVPQDLILVTQVTEFACGGFVVCFGYNHAVFDGFGIMNFFRAVGEMARGLEKPVIEPIWCRDIIPGPPPKPEAHLSSSSAIPNLHLELSSLDVHLDKIKEEYDMKQTGRTCSDFDVLMAVLLQCRTRAINPEHAETLDVHLVCPSNVRALLHELIPGYAGYYGNCTFHALVTAPASKIMQASVTDIVGWILDAKGRISDGFWKWLRGELSDKSIASFCNYETIVVSDLDKLGCENVNYGWGAPVQSGMLRYSDHMVFCVINSSPKIKGGVRITGRLVREEHLQAFHDEMNKACN